MTDHKVILGLARVSHLAEALGLGEEGEIVAFVWDMEDSPNAVIIGKAGGGKSVLVRLIITACAMAGWQVVLIDPKRVEMTPFRGRQGIHTVAARMPEMREAMAWITAETERRYEVMERAGVQKSQELPEPFPPLLVVVDESFELFVQEQGRDDDTKALNDIKAAIAGETRHGAAFARAADIHFVLLAQRPDAKVLEGSLRNNLHMHAMLRPATADKHGMGMVELGQIEYTGNPKGRAAVSTDAWPECEVQVAYLDVQDLDKYLPMAPPPPTPATDEDGPEPHPDGPGQPGVEDSAPERSGAESCDEKPLSDEDLAALLDGEDDDE